MKNNFFCIIMAIICFSCQSKQIFVELTDWEKDNLKGSVQLIKEYRDTLLLQIIEYNTLGYKEKVLFYMPPKGNLWKEMNFVYDNNYLVEAVSIVDNDEIYKTQYKRNKHYQIEEEIIIYSNNEINERLLYEYDNRNRIIKTTYVPQNLNTYYYTFEYTPQCIKEFHSSYGLSYVNDLNSKGLVIKRNEYKSNGEIHSGKIYEYNESNDVVLEIELWNNKETDRIGYEYTYDNKGNWITKNAKWKNGGGYYLKRKIIYY